MKKNIWLFQIILLLLFVSPLFHFIDVKADTVLKTSIGNFELFWSNQPGVLSLPISENTEETYNPNDRNWNGLPTITRTSNGRLWAAWMTGGFLEPDSNNYNVLYYSDDNGNTWSDEFLIIESKDPSRAVYDPRLFHDGDGLLWLYLNYGGSKGIIMTNPDCENPSENLTFSNSAYSLTSSPFAHRPTILSDKWNCVWIAPVESSRDLVTQKIFATSNKVVWEELSSVSTSSPNAKRFNESQIVELNDGRLMMLSRLDGGSGIERCFSEDGGRTWSTMETNLSCPMIGPGSKFHIQRLNSGALLFINHNSLTSREKLTVYLSYDEGITWPHSLVLDDREGFNGGLWGVSYPEAADTQGPNGEIYIVWDQRTPLLEINSAVITENDIKAGEIITENGFSFKPIVRNSPYYDIVNVEEDFDKNITVNIGTTKTSIIELLPTSFHITDALNQSYEISGIWKTLDYNSNKVGCYSFIFEPSLNSNEYLIDSYNLLRVRVEVLTSQADSNGCSNTIIYVGAIIVGLTGIAFLYLRKMIKR